MTTSEPDEPDEPTSVIFCASEYADKLTFDAIPAWLTAALESGDVKGVFKGEDYWYLEVKTGAGVVTAEPGDVISRREDGTLHVSAVGAALAAYVAPRAGRGRRSDNAR